jgi:hypothetical protein
MVTKLSHRRVGNSKVGVGGIKCKCCRSGSKFAKQYNSRVERRRTRLTLKSTGEE